MGPQKKTYPLSWHLVLLVLAAMLPFFIFSALMVNRLVGYERAASERRLRTTSLSLATSIDKEIESSLRTLDALAASLIFKNRNLKEVHSDLVRIHQSQPTWLTVLLHSPEGKTLLNSRVPFSESLVSAAEPTTLLKLFATGKPIVGSIARGVQSSEKNRQWAFAVRVPVYDNGRIAYALSAVITNDALQKIAQHSESPLEYWTQTIIDSEGTIAARSRNPQEFVGKKARSAFYNLIKEKEHGMMRSTTLEGKHVYSAYNRSPISGWTVVVAVPTEVLDAPTLHALLTVLGVGLLLLCAFGGIALFYARALANKIHSVSAGANELAQGTVPIIEHSRVREMNDLRHALLQASKHIIEREKERNELLTRAHDACAVAESANLAKSEFLANMSHELRTPLGVVLGYADLLTKNLVPPESREKLVETMKRNGHQLLRLIDDILDLSKVEASKLTLEHIDFSLPDLISNLMLELKPLANAKGLSFNVISDRTLPEIVKSDPVRIRQVLINIIGNSIKFTSNGKIEVRVKSQADMISLTVHDTGIGLNPAQQEQLFKSFTQADNSHTRRFGGTGLGLILSKKIAQLLGGDVELLESVPGQGSTFAIWFTVKVSQKSVPPLLDALPALASPLAGVKILLAEDSPDNVRLILTYLENAGASVEVVENGVEALQKMQQEKYHIVLMDIQMPQMDGYQATQKLRDLGFRLPIIALTAHALHAHREKALAHGYSNYLAKPFDSSQLIAIIIKNLDSARNFN